MAKDLIIVRASKRSLHNVWLDSKTPRPWDLLICPYEDIPSSQPEGVYLSEVIPASKWKWGALDILLNEWQEWRKYRYVLLADDDLLASQDTWSKFFERCAHYGAQLAQPGLRFGSYFSHPMTMQSTQFAARRVSFVEIMMPCFRSDVLAQLQATFKISPSGSGLGLDLLWAKQLEYKHLFIIDETAVHHTRPVHGAYPERLNEFRREAADIVRRFQVPWLMKTFAGYLPGGQEVPERDGSFLYRLFQGHAHIFEAEPKRFEEMMRLQLEAGNPYADYLQ